MIEVRALQHDTDTPRQPFDEGLAWLSLLIAPAAGVFVPPLTPECHQNELAIRTAAEFASVAGASQYPRPGAFPLRPTVQVPEFPTNRHTQKFGDKRSIR